MNNNDINSNNNNNDTGTPAAALDSPRTSESPPPPGSQGDIELELVGLANALYNLGTTVVNDSSKERDKLPGASKQVGPRVNDVVSHLSNIDEMAQTVRTMIPIQVLTEIDNARNPMNVTKDRIERAATENQFMNGKIAAIESYRNLLNEALRQNFPELEEALRPLSEDVHMKTEEETVQAVPSVNGAGAETGS